MTIKSKPGEHSDLSPKTAILVNVSIEKPYKFLRIDD